MRFLTGSGNQDVNLILKIDFKQTTVLMTDEIQFEFSPVQSYTVLGSCHDFLEVARTS